MMIRVVTAIRELLKGRKRREGRMTRIEDLNHQPVAIAIPRKILLMIVGFSFMESAIKRDKV